MLKPLSNSTAKYYNYCVLLSLLHKHKHSRRAIQQIHSHFIVSGAGSYKGSLALWNSVLKHYALGLFPAEALLVLKYLKGYDLYCDNSPIALDSFTYSYSIKACGNTGRVRVGNQLHCLSCKAGFHCQIHVQTALVNMYVDCGFLVDARKLFDEMPERNLVTWNVLLTGYVKWGDVESARVVFEAMPERNVISWTGLIDGYTRANRCYEALSVFRKMVVDEGIEPTGVTLLAIFPAIWNTGCLEFCQMIHVYGEKSGFNESDIRIVNCLIDAYAKCGSIESARRVFEDVEGARRSMVTWTSIISGFAMHGMAKESLDYYKRMENTGVTPNEITFLSMLSACSHGGLVNEGLEFYRRMVEDYGIEPNVKHYGMLIDMLGRAGRLEEAERMASNVPMELGNVVIWRTLLGACSFHGNIEMGERITAKVMEIEKKHGGDYVLMSNILSTAGRFVDSERLRSVMMERKALRVHGITLV